MPEVDVSASVSVKEQQSDELAAGEVSVSFKDNLVDDYNGPIRLKLPAVSPDPSIKTIDVSHLTSLRVIIIKRLAGGDFRLSLRRSATSATDLVVSRFFAAEITNIEQIKLTNEGQADVEVQVELVSISG